MVLFVIYLVLYVGFVLINAFAADVMDLKVFAGLNLAIVYGFGLIVSALILACIYGVLAKVDTDEAETGHDSEGEQA